MAKKDTELIALDWYKGAQKKSVIGLAYQRTLATDRYFLLRHRGCKFTKILK